MTPLSKKKGFTLDKAGRLKCFLSSAPEQGKANRELIELFSDALHIPRRCIQIVSGETGRRKRIAIETELSYEEILANLGIEITKNMF